MSLPKGPLVAWYGDDFTGASAVMEALEFAGLPAVLFLDTPGPEQLARFAQARGIGIASTARTKTPGWMDETLPDAFAALRATGAPVIHYKTCSTLDSAPGTGSIGRAIEIGAQGSESPVPVLVASPNMRRFQAFGHLFAGFGDGVYRLDRHPVMARHPVTPMDESDVARHLSRQTDLTLGCVTVEDLASDPAAAFRREAEHARIVTLDAMTMRDMAANGALIWNARPVFCAGSQGVEYALVDHWRSIGALPVTERSHGAGPVAQMLAVSGSVSSVTADQTAWAEENGWAVIPLDAAALVAGRDAAEARALDAAWAALAQGRDTLIASARGPDDPGVAMMRDAARAAGLATDAANERIGQALGRILKTLLEETGLRRAVISGGDTSGFAMQALDVFALTALAPTVPGAALLRAYSEDTARDGLQLALKGGQMGSRDFLGWIKDGGGRREE